MRTCCSCLLTSNRKFSNILFRPVNALWNSVMLEICEFMLVNIACGCLVLNMTFFLFMIYGLYYCCVWFM